ncbi:PEP-CTERM sorting domain-containing protein [Hahella sp. HN01]|uniref:PEP-CTERM sorting domain-containing protein n=1 Tax=Hahella sp. HN01 TaxID=2847262 RepID=UPI001C1EFF9D|nr:PEP-CTERM sorting domain-containing protein [Hahella sp. HN01]
MKTTQGLGILTSFVFVSCASVAQATVIDWNNTGGGDFNNDANWVGGTAPSASDSASFNTGADSAYTASLSEDVNVQGVSVKSDEVVIDLDGHNLEMQDGISVNSHSGGHLTLKNGVLNRDRDDTDEEIRILVGSESGSKGSLVLDGMETGRSAFLGMKYYVGFSDTDSGGGEGLLELKNKTHISGYSTHVDGRLALNDEAFMGLNEDLYLREGVIEVNGGSWLSAEEAELNGKVLMDGNNSSLSAQYMNLTEEGTISITNGARVSAELGGYYGKVVIDGKNSSMDIWDTAYFGGDLIIQNGATMTGSYIKIGKSLTIEAGSKFDEGSYFFIDGTTTVKNGASLSSRELIVRSGGALVMEDSDVDVNIMQTEGGKVQGSGVIRAGDVPGEYSTIVWNNDGGVVATGENGGTLTIKGDYWQEESATLQLTLGDWGSIGDFMVNVEGEARLDGILKIDLWETFKPEVNDEFSLFSASNISGMFSHFELPDIGPYLEWISKSREVDGMETYSIKVIRAPEPYTLVLMTIGLAGFAGARRFRKAV